MPYLGREYYAVSGKSYAARSIPLMLLHGAGGSHLSWPTELRRLAGRTVYAPDFPGHGKSEGVGIADIAGLAENAVGWLRELWTNRAVWCGHSMGAAVVLEIAERFPETSAGMILIGAGIQLPVQDAELEACRHPDQYASLIDSRMERLLSPKASPLLRMRIRKSLRDERPTVLYRDLSACRKWQFSGSKMLDGIPALMICGSDDAMVPQNLARRLASGLPDCAMEILADTGHLAMLERPKAVAELVEKFVRELQ